MKSLAERHAQRNDQRAEAGLDPIDYGSIAGAKNAIASADAKKNAKAKAKGDDTVDGGNGGDEAAKTAGWNKGA